MMMMMMMWEREAEDVLQALVLLEHIVASVEAIARIFHHLQLLLCHCRERFQQEDEGHTDKADKRFKKKTFG